MLLIYFISYYFKKFSHLWLTGAVAFDGSGTSKGPKYLK